MVTFFYNNHRFDVNWSKWSGKETVLYDKRVVSELRNLSSSQSLHDFKVEEDGKSVLYFVEIKEYGFQVEARRDGVLFYSRKDGGIVADPPSMTHESQPIIKETIIKEITLVVCPNCNHRNDSSKRTCEKCGASI